MDELLQNLRQAEQNFNYADQEHIDSAIREFNVAEEKVNAKVREAKWC